LLKEYSMNCLKKTRPYEGITNLLDGLDRRRIKRAVFSNKIDHLTKRIVEALFPGRLFPVVVGAGAGMPEKPDPTGVLSVARQLGIEPEHLIYVGDSDVDMETAHNLGCTRPALSGVFGQEGIDCSWGGIPARASPRPSEDCRRGEPDMIRPPIDEYHPSVQG
jgi:phosphoglycolate phosphatase-like HAD superfamily hydrolase